MFLEAGIMAEGGDDSPQSIYQPIAFFFCNIINTVTLFETISACVGLSVLSGNIELTFENTAIILKTVIILVTLTVRLNFHTVTSLDMTSS